LVGAARLSVDIGHDLRLNREPLLAAVFELIEQHFEQPISLATVAADEAHTVTPTAWRRQTRHLPAR
jgi:AraC family transcriptional activator of pobA